ncbi:MAG: ATP-binding protein, partial [Promethearchaeota archaeon]
MNSQGKDLGGLILKQLKQFIQLDQDDVDKESETELSIQIDKLKRWLELNENLDADNLFKNRVPLGMIIPSMSKIDFCVGIKNENNPERPLINTIVLIYDEKYNEIYSGIITSIKSVKNPKISAIGRNINVNTKGNRVKGANNSASSSSKKKSAKKGPAKNTNNAINVNNADNKGANLSTSSNIGGTSILFSIQLYFKHDVNFKNYYRVTSIMSDMSYVFTANADEIKKIYGLPEEGVNLGVCTQNGELIETSQGFLYYYLDPELLKTHLCIGGLTGRGKTIFLKNLIFDVTKKEFTPRVHSIIFDLQGDLVQLMKKMPNNLIPKKYRNLYEKFNLEPQGLEDILINEEILFLKPFYIRAEGFLKIFPWKNFGLRSYRITTGEELVSLMPLLTDLAKATLISLFNFFMNNVTHFHFETFYQWVLNNKKIERKTKYVWYMPETNETVSANISTGDSMLRALEQLRSLHIFDVYDEIDIKNMLKKKIVFIYFPRAKGYTLVRSMFLLQILKLIYEYKVHRRSGLFYTYKTGDKKDQSKNVSISRTKPIPEKELDKIKNNSLSKSKDQRNNMGIKDDKNNDNGSLGLTYDEGNENGVDLIKKVNSRIINHLIVIDEAHELLPARSKNSQLSSSFFNYIEKEFKNIAKEGRKYGIWLVISTQLLSELNNVVVVNAQTKVLFEISGDDEKKINSDRMLRDILKDLKQGEAVVYNRDNLKLSK